VAEEGNEFQQLFAGAYCLSRRGEKFHFYPLKLRMFPKSVLPACFCQEDWAHLASFWWISTRLHRVTFRVTVNDMRTSHLTYIGPCIVIYFYSKTNQMHNFSIYSGKVHSTYFGGLSVHLQEFRTVHTASDICTALNSWRWTERPSETCRVYFSRINWEIVHLVGFTREMWISMSRYLMMYMWPKIGSVPGCPERGNKLTHWGRGFSIV